MQKNIYCKDPDWDDDYYLFVIKGRIWEINYIN